MSHITNVAVEIRDLDALIAAAADCGLEFRKDQKTHRWYGRYVGDWPLPDGVAVADLGKCDHALHVVGNDKAYEIGVRQSGEQWLLQYDFWSGGYGLEKHVGKKCQKLAQRYNYHASINRATELGYSLSNETVLEDGTVELEFDVKGQQQWAWNG